MQVPVDGIARIADDAEEARIVGTAFLVSPRHVMTCAHVVNDAFSRDWDEPTEPRCEHKIIVDFPFAKDVGRCNAHVIEWSPPKPSESADVAVLELDREVAIRPYRTVFGRPRQDHEFWTMGFPAGQDSGMDASGTLGSPREFGRLIAHGNSLPGFFITGGFSGAPLFDTEAGVVLGMAAEAARDESRRTAIIVPAEQLELIWPPLARPYKGLAAFQEGDSRFFFGRGRYIDELMEKLARRPLVLRSSDVRVLANRRSFGPG
jgi:hypothetical protein